MGDVNSISIPMWHSSGVTPLVSCMVRNSGVMRPQRPISAPVFARRGSVGRVAASGGGHG